jgi:hypothetical protein
MSLKRNIFIAFSIFGLGLCILISIADAKRINHEKFYQDEWCAANGGETEVVLPDRARCDCLTSTHAIEFDFADKWAEAVGQALYYALMLDKPAGIVLIMENPEKDQKYLDRLNKIVNFVSPHITVWIAVP